MSIPKLKVYRLDPAATIPRPMTEESACFDLCACFGKRPHDEVTIYSPTNKVTKHFAFPDPVSNKREITIRPGERALIPTGLIFDIPKGYSVRLHPRSGNALKLGLTLPQAEGVIDSDYVQQVYMIVHNTSQANVVIGHGDRVCQGELVALLSYTIEETLDKPSIRTNRTGGFGSTGT